MSEDLAVIHKLAVPLVTGPQTFRVPRTAKLVNVGPDTRERDALAVWYRFTLAHDGYTGPEYTTDWRLQIVGTGVSFPADAWVLGTVVWPGFAWHVVDLDAVISR